MDTCLGCSLSGSGPPLRLRAPLVPGLGSGGSGGGSGIDESMTGGGSGGESEESEIGDGETS